MATIADLTRDREQALAEARSILDNAETESRSLTSDETRRHDEAMANVRRLAVEIEEERGVDRSGVDRVTGLGNTDDGQRWLPSTGEYRALSEAQDSTGGAIVPVEHVHSFFDRLRAVSVFLGSGPRILTTETDETHLPKIGSSASGAWVAENSQINPSDQTFEQVTLKPKKAAVMTYASNEVMSDSNPAAREVVAYDLERTLAGMIDAGMLIGDGQGAAPTGLANATGVHVEALGAVASLDDLADALGRVEDANAAPSAIYCSPAQWKAWRNEKDTTERRLVAPVTEAGRRILFGVPVFVTGHLSAANKAIVADLAQVAVAQRQDVEVAMSSDFRFDYDQTAVRAIGRFDVAPLNAAAVDVMDTSAA